MKSRTIYLNDMNIKEAPSHKLRQRISIVTQAV
jgi:hypothetical protein